jgi:flagellar hook-basal body complex protein FliE
VSISAIGALGSIAAPAPVSAASGANGTSGSDFASALAGGLEQVQSAQDKADGLAVKAATGNLTDVHDYMIASTEAQLATQLTVAVSNKAVAAFNDIMRMQA